MTPAVLPVVVICAQEFDLQLSQVMYAHHVTKAALSSLQHGRLSEAIFHNIYSHATLKVIVMNED